MLFIAMDEALKGSAHRQLSGKWRLKDIVAGVSVPRPLQYPLQRDGGGLRTCTVCGGNTGDRGSFH